MDPETVDLLRRLVTIAFVGTWIILGIGGAYLFYLGRDAALKRKWYSRFAIFAGILFVGLSAMLELLGPQSREVLMLVIFMVIPFFALITYINIKTIKFCGKSGALSYDYGWFNSTKFCSKCGAALDAKPNFRDGMME